MGRPSGSRHKRRGSHSKGVQHEASRHRRRRFIGYHVAQALLDRGERVIGVDDLNDYYDVA